MRCIIRELFRYPSKKRDKGVVRSDNKKNVTEGCMELRRVTEASVSGLGAGVWGCASKRAHGDVRVCIRERCRKKELHSKRGATQC